MIVVSQNSNRRVEVPLLKGYLRTVPSYPDHVPGWVPIAGWSIFAVLVVLLAVVAEMAIIGTALAGLIAWGIFTLLKSFYKPRNAAERADEMTHDAVRKLKKAAGESHLQKRLPLPVLLALEEAVQAHNTAIARLASEDPILAVEGTKQVRNALHACFLASIPVLRNDEHSRREWAAMQTKDAMINEIVDSIHSQTLRMKGSLSLNTERLEAMRELDDLSDSVRALD